MRVQSINTDAFGVNDEPTILDVVSGKMSKKRKQMASFYSGIEMKSDKAPVIYVDDAYAEEQIAAATKEESEEIELTL